MRPLDLHHDAPDDGDAPLSAMTDTQCFWDHLGATRAEEYAQEDILPQRPVPRPRGPVGPVSANAPGQRPAIDQFAIADCRLGSLDDTLQAMDGFSSPDSGFEAVMGAETDSVAFSAVIAGQGRGFEAANIAFQGVSAPARGAGMKQRHRRRRLADSRLGYRLQRFWLTPTYRLGLKFGLPAIALCVAAASYFSIDTNREALSERFAAVYGAVVDRPEFMVTTLQWPEVTPELDAALRARLNVELPQSSFRLDLDALRVEVEALDWVRSADLRLLADGVLALSITERVPAILWRSDSGLEMLDAEGVRVAHVASRDLRADLALIAGGGADGHIREALDLLDAASPLGTRVLGLVRVGERRWDVVLDRGQRIRLPEKGALAALERVIALEQAQDLLSRDLVVADLRNPARPVLQISAGAVETLRDIRSQSLEALQ